MIINSMSVASGQMDVPTNIRCPGCGQMGTFERLISSSQEFSLANQIVIGERRCPNTECRTVIFVVWQGKQIARSYPPLRIDFGKTNIPSPIVAALEEAITCHANECFIAAGIMVRKTLEELSCAVTVELREKI
jgi:hypothetical protein